MSLPSLDVGLRSSLCSFGLTNVAVIRLKKGGKRFEVRYDGSSVMRTGL